MSTQSLALFPGQGSQKVGMGKELVERHEVARRTFAEADETLGFSLSKLCFEGPADQLTATAVAQPAILTVSIAAWRIACASDNPPDICASAGHSLGEYSALVAAEALTFADAVELVNRRGRYMQEAVPAGTGKMVAVLGQETEAVESALAKVSSGSAQIANLNAPGQIVVAGDVAAVDLFCATMSGAKIMPLQVSAPFHCALMEPARERLKQDLAQLEIKKPRFPVYANFSAEAVEDPELIRRSLADQVTGRVRWVECMRNAIARHSPAKAIEFGAGNVITGLMKRIAPELPRETYYGA